MSRCEYACRTADHAIGRRAFLGARGGRGRGALRAGRLRVAGRGPRPGQGRQAGAHHLPERRRQPTRDLGPEAGDRHRRAVPGHPDVRPRHRTSPSCCPQTAKQMHRMALVRGVNTAEDEHGRGATIMLTGRRPEPGFEYPHLGAVAAKLLGSGTEELPGHIEIHPGGGGGFSKQDAAFLGPRFASVALGDGKPPAGPVPPRRPDRPKPTASARPCARSSTSGSPSPAARPRRRRTPSRTTRRPSVVARGDAFDCTKEDPRAGRPVRPPRLRPAPAVGPPAARDRASRSSSVQHTNYDTHHENFDFHIEQVGEFDGPFATLLDDLADRGMLDIDPGRGHVRVRADAAHQPPVRPRPLVEGVVRGARRGRPPPRGGGRQDERERDGGGGRAR